MAAPPFKVKAVYEYVSEHDDDLQFPLGQIITVTELEGDDWYVGEYSDQTGAKKEGLFPSNFVEKYEPDVPARPTRPTRAKQEVQSPPPPAPVPAPAPAPAPAQDEEDEDEEDAEAGAQRSMDLPRSPPIAGDGEASIRPPVAETVPPSAIQPPPAPKPTPAQPAEPPVTATPPPAKKAPPPIAAKSNAFKDRIAAFNQPAAAPIAPIQPGRKPQANEFIKKQFVAPPPSKNAYVPPPKVEHVQKPYHREEDPEIQQRQAEDQAAAEAAGLTSEPTAPVAKEEVEEDEDAPKPMTLKERMALLQQQQQEQAQRRAEVTQKKKPPPPKRPSESEQMPAAAPEDEEVNEGQGSAERQSRKSLDAPRAKPRVPSAQPRPPEPVIPAADPDLHSDGHEADQSAADETTEDDTGTLGPDDSDARSLSARRHPAAPAVEPDVGEEDDTTERDGEGEEEGAAADEAEEEEEEDSMDEEERRKQELRARMARLGGAQPGMGMMLGFAGPPPAAPKKSSSRDKRHSEDNEPRGSSEQQRRVPMIPVPGMPRMQSPESDTTQKIHRDEDEEDEEDIPEAQAPPPPKRTSTIDRAPPPVPKDSRPVPPPPSQETGAAPPVPSGSRLPPAPEARAVPPPPPRAEVVASPGPGSESDDELSMRAKRSSAEASGVETPLPIRPGPPPVPVGRDVPPLPPQSPPDKRTSYFSGAEPSSATSDKRSSRAVPPLPSSPPPSSRPVPPPPPGQAPSRSATMDSEHIADMDERISSDYDGDYDTDIASNAPPKEALKAPHNREPSLTDSPSTADDLPTPVPPVPQASAPRAVPPPPPPHAAPRSRPSMDRPPPPVPPPADPSEDAEYDPYRSGSVERAPPPPPVAAPSSQPLPPPPSVPQVQQYQSSADELYEEPPPPPARQSMEPPRQSMERARAPPAPERVAASIPQQVPQSRQSLDVNRSGTVSRRSGEMGRPSGEHGQIANDIDLPTDAPWWTAEQPLPPALQPRRNIDILSECEESSKSKRGGRKEVSKDIYVLFMDYSQTIISVRYDSQEPEDVHLEQRHEPPPPKLRQDQLEAAWQRFGKAISDAAKSLGSSSSKKDSIVADGSATALPFELIKSNPAALLPIGSRSYGALVYANLANASTMQFDEIRPGDIITVRNAKFEGHHGAMKTKYKADFGPSHVAVVDEWDGTKRAVRAWEQGRDKKAGVRSEKFRLADLRSGEVRVWRVVGRDWVGWE